jgi:hypothetical protein
MSHHVPPDFALIVAALDPSDPERCAAWAHARDCKPCERILQQGEVVLQLIDAQAPDQFIDPALKERILTSVANLPAAPRRRAWPRIGVAIGAAISAVLALFDGAERVGLFAAVGVRCVFWELMFALVPLALTAQVALSTGRGRGPWVLALAGVIGGLAGQTYLRVRCPMHDANPHLLVFHCAGVLAAAATGVLIARAMRWAR